jgi:hypothetical protein
VGSNPAGRTIFASESYTLRLPLFASGDALIDALSGGFLWSDGKRAVARAQVLASSAVD